MTANPGGPVAPGCLLSAFGKLTVSIPDSLNAHAVVIAAELDRRGTASKDLLESEVVLFSRARRFAEASRAYDKLIAIDKQPAMNLVALAATAARQRGDTAALTRIMSAAAGRADASPAYRAESNVLRQVGALKGAIMEARGLIRQNPKYVAAYPSLVGNFGTLGMTDSVVSYVRRALAQGATRAAIGPAIDPLVTVMLRHATLYGSAYRWDAEVAAAMRVDSALSTPSTKFLIAALVAQSAERQIAEISPMINGSSLAARNTGAGANDAAQGRAAGCARVAPVLAQIDVAEAKLSSGGDKYTGGGVQMIVSGLAAERERLVALRDFCGKF
jgi:hypothetical protein